MFGLNRHPRRAARRLGRTLAGATAIIALFLVLVPFGCLSTAGLTGGEDDAGLVVDTAPPDPNPCGADLQNDVTNCGKCGHACAFGVNSFPRCMAGACSIGCNAGTGNCDGDDTNGCEAATSGDALNCGECGHTCMGGACTLGACQPFVISSMTERPTAVAVDANYLYVAGYGAAITDGFIRRYDKDGNNPIDLVTGVRYPWALAVDGGYIYWLQPSTVSAAPYDGLLRRIKTDGTGMPEDHATGLAVVTTSRLHLDGGFLYFGDYYAQTIRRCAVQAACGDQSETLATAQSVPYAATAVGQTLYWVAASTIRSCTIGDCATPKDIAPGQGTVYSIAASPTALYWVSSNGTISQYDPAKDEVTVLVAAQPPTPRDLIVDTTHVYWTVYATQGSVRRCAVGGCGGNAELIAGDQRQPFYIAADTTAVFWTNAVVGAGAVTKLAK